MSRTNEHIHGSHRLRRALGLGLSGTALVGLIYFEGMSARAEAGADESLVEDAEEADEADALDEVDAAELEADVVDERADAEEAADNDVPKPDPMILPPSGAATPAAAPAPASPTDGRLAMATVGDDDAAAAKPVPPPAPALVVVPDIEGMSVRKAKKALAAVGLKMSVRDEYDWALPRAYWGQYKVRKQKIDAGTEVAPGSTVKVKARMLAKYAMGY